MNLSATSASETTSHECELHHHLGGILDHTTTWANVVLVVLIVVNIITCPFTIVLNSLVMVAVKTKARIKNKSNIALGCLAVTDMLMGVIGQPVFAANMISILQGDMSNEHCTLQQLSRIVLRLLSGASIRHLVLINVERYIAIKHSFTYTTKVTKTRVLGSSVLAWITVFVANIPLLLTDTSSFLNMNNVLLFIFIAVLVFCQITVYSETRRQEKAIAAQQVSGEARQKFLKERKAFKITTTVLIALISCYTPAIIVRILVMTSKITSVNIAYIAYSMATFLAMLNSIINPIIYCVRLRQFRVAFIQILLRKNYTQAEQFERRMFRTLDIVAPLESGQEREEVQNNVRVSLNNINDDNNNSGEGSNNDNNNNNNRNNNNNENNNNKDDDNNNNNEDDDNNNNNSNNNEDDDNNNNNSNEDNDDDNNNEDDDNNNNNSNNNEDDDNNNNNSNEDNDDDNNNEDDDNNDDNDNNKDNDNNNNNNEDDDNSNNDNNKDDNTTTTTTTATTKTTI